MVARSNTSVQPRMSLQTLLVLQAFLSQPATPMAGADVSKLGKIATGTLYPILFRLEGAGWLESRWEDIDPSVVGRPRRRFYRLTADGQRQAVQVLGTVGGLAPA